MPHQPGFNIEVWMKNISNSSIRPILHTTPTKKTPQVRRHTVPINFQLFHRSLLLSIHKNLHSLSRLLRFLTAPPDAAALACFIKSLAPSTSDCTAAAPPDAAALDCFIESLAPSTSNRTAA
eukprot:jgi/Psemu1/53171/gm1.53171_g